MKKFLVLMLLVCGTAYAGDKTMTEFYMEGCPHCKKMESVIRSFSEGSGVIVSVVKDKALAQSKGVQSFPTFIIENNGKMIGRHVGEFPLEGLKAFWTKPTIQEPLRRPEPQMPKRPLDWYFVGVNLWLFLIALRAWTRKG